MWWVTATAGNRHKARGREMVTCRSCSLMRKPTTRGLLAVSAGALEIALLIKVAKCSGFTSNCYLYLSVIERKQMSIDLRRGDSEIVT